MSKSIGEMTAEIRQVNIDKGWRPAEGGPGDNTFGDYLALLHSEVSEALEAYRDHRLADATGSGALHVRDNVRLLPKPEGVGSELADVLIRLLDMADVFGYTPFDMDMELGDVDPEFPVVIQHIRDAGEHPSFGDWVRALHSAVVDVDHTPTIYFPHLLRQLVCFAEGHGIDLDAEYERKLAYNRTRSFRHGGRAL